MVDLQRGFIHTLCGIADTRLLDFVFFLCPVYCGHGQSESRSNGAFAKDFHPHLIWKCEHVTFGLCGFFIILCVVMIDKNESRSNGGLAKGFHPHFMWNYGHSILYFLI